MSKSKVNIDSLKNVRISYVAAICLFMACIGSLLLANITLERAEKKTNQVALLISDFDARASDFIRIMRNETKSFDASTQRRLNQILYAIRYQIVTLEEKLKERKSDLEVHSSYVALFEELLGAKRATSTEDTLLRYNFMLSQISNFVGMVKKFPEDNRKRFLENSEQTISLFDRIVAPNINKASNVFTKRLDHINTMAIKVVWIFGTIMTGVILGVLFFIFIPMERTVARSIEGMSEAMNRAELADRAKSEFLANMSHEIRTPMNGVMGMAELLQRTELNEKQAAFADIIVRSGNSLLTIINDILDFSKIDAGQMDLDPAPFHLGDAIEDVATLVSSKVAEKDLELALRIDPNLPTWFVGDVGRIRQIVTNLVGNAVKFTESGQIYINISGHTEKSITSLTIDIEDTGIGIDEDKLTSIFEKFSQIDESATRKHEGTGLGLAISNSLVHLMGGKMSVESKLDHGSKFSFEIELPVHSGGELVTTIPEELKGLRVLVVDDNEVNRSILLENLNAWEFECAGASSGKEALAALRAMKDNGIEPHCIILDYQMPEMSGGTVARTMREDYGLAHIPIIMLTSVDQMEDGSKFSSLAIQGHLVKPARTKLLMQTLVQVLQEVCNDNSETRMGVSMARRMATIDTSAPITDTVSDRDLVEKTSVDPEDQMVTRLVLADDPEVSVPNSRVEAIVQPDDYGSLYASHDDRPERIDILVAEDNEVNQIVITQILQSTGYSFKIANNGREALELYGAHRPKLICMDVSMPIKNGHQATREIREIEEGTGIHTPIIGVTAHAIKGDMEMCFEAGMDDYMSKPVSPEKLEEKIERWMRKSQVEKSLSA